MLHDFPPHKQNYLTPQCVAKTVIYQLKPADKEQIRVTAIPASLPVQTESRLLFAKVWEERAMESNCLMDTGFLL